MLEYKEDLWTPMGYNYYLPYLPSGAILSENEKRKNKIYSLHNNLNEMQKGSKFSH